MDEPRIIEVAPGSLVVVGAPLDSENDGSLAEFADALGRRYPHGVVVVLADGITLDVLGDEQLAELGLQRIPT